MVAFSLPAFTLRDRCATEANILANHDKYEGKSRILLKTKVRLLLAASADKLNNDAHMTQNNTQC